MRYPWESSSAWQTQVDHVVNAFGEQSARRQELGAALRRLRRAAGLSGEELAADLQVSQSRISRIELGRQNAGIPLVSRWAQIAGADDAEQGKLVQLAEAAETETVSWRQAASDGLAALQRDSRDLEATARVILNFQIAGIPGLLQVPEYARRVFAAGHPAGQTDIPAAVAARMNRQAILYDEARHLEFVMTEGAVRWRLGPPSLMLAQLDRIVTVSSLENVTIGVIPLDAEADVWHDHGFNILDERDEDEPVVHVETLTSGLTITAAEDVAAFRERFARLRELAVTGDDARGLHYGCCGGTALKLAERA